MIYRLTKYVEENYSDKLQDTLIENKITQENLNETKRKKALLIQLLSLIYMIKSLKKLSI